MLIRSCFHLFKFPLLKNVRVSRFSYFNSLYYNKPYAVSRNIRGFSSEKIVDNKKEEQPQQEFIPLFHLTYIRALSAIAMLKNYTGFCTLIMPPATLALEMGDFIESGSWFSALACGLSLTGTLSLFSWQISNTIGMIYVSKDMKRLKISYIDFWGRRVNTVVDANEWMMLSEIPGTFTSKVFLTARLYDSNKKWKLFLNHGLVLDDDKFSAVLGKP